jgi:hypothetical protein
MPTNRNIRFWNVYNVSYAEIQPVHWTFSKLKPMWHKSLDYLLVNNKLRMGNRVEARLTSIHEVPQWNASRMQTNFGLVPQNRPRCVPPSSLRPKSETICFDAIVKVYNVTCTLNSTNFFLLWSYLLIQTSNDIKRQIKAWSRWTLLAWY